MKKTNKLSALEKLAVKKAYLKAEEQCHLDRLNEHVNYLQDNWGSLLIDSGLNIIKSRTLPFTQNLLGNKNGKIFTSNDSVCGFFKKYPHISSVVSYLIDILPLLLKGKKSLMFAIVLKNIKDFLFVSK